MTLEHECVLVSASVTGTDLSLLTPSNLLRDILRWLAKFCVNKFKFSTCCCPLSLSVCVYVCVYVYVCVCVCSYMNWFVGTVVSFFSTLCGHSGLWDMVFVFHKTSSLLYKRNLNVVPINCVWPKCSGCVCCACEKKLVCGDK